MATRSKVINGQAFIETKPKKTRQGNGSHTKYAASSRNNKPKRYRGQGRWDLKLEKQWKCCGLLNGIFQKQQPTANFPSRRWKLRLMNTVISIHQHLLKNPKYWRNPMATNHVPDHVPWMMKQDHGTTVLITDPKSDKYLNMASTRRERSNNTKTS